MLKRFRHNYQLSILALMGLLPICTLPPFAIYRFMTGNLVVGLLDSFIVLLSILGIGYAWRTGDVRRPGLIISLAVSFGAVLVSLRLGLPGTLWVYVAILFNFFMVAPWGALLITTVMIATTGYLGYGRAFEDVLQLLSFFVTSITASGLALIFAVRTRSQQERLELLATLDPLTSAGNRRALDAELHIAAANWRRHGLKHAVLVMDLDHFKQINDRYGHSVGDRTLVELVERLRRTARREDRLFRVGGEEFLLLLPGVDLEGAMRVAGKLLTQIGNHPFEDVGQVTLSIGGALLGDPSDWSNDIRRADALLYQAKVNGRDRALVEDRELLRNESA